MSYNCKGLCVKLKAKAAPNGTRYIIGQKRCSCCSIFLFTCDIRCPCCKTILRTKSRKSREEFNQVKVFGDNARVIK